MPIFAPPVRKILARTGPLSDVLGTRQASAIPGFDRSGTIELEPTESYPFRWLGMPYFKALGRKAKETQR